MYVLLKRLYFYIDRESGHTNKQGMATNSFTTLISHWEVENDNHNIVFSVLIAKGKIKKKIENKQGKLLQYKA